ncbi:hypothetical protein E2N92_05065 [Methanofollis formosanus]|uniref:Uncharacterized protein n=1 Tax=Methanofollis formosanus TaxID=299308 RepID=A0A8G1A1S2_9EURY|nr:hypothetical protein [Methanofollis formosanus]QYZ78843.1 hypothetical protein E2N92_05065 [Methanofollis formosanus]
MGERVENVVVLLVGVILLIGALATTQPFPPFTPGENGEVTTPAPTPESTDTPDTTREIFRYASAEYENQTFTVPVNVTAPPLTVRYTVTPRLITEGPDRVPSPESWFVVRIVDEEGTVVREDGYGTPAGEKGGYSRNEKGTLEVFATGTYTVEVRFNEMIAEVVVGTAGPPLMLPSQGSPSA